MSRLSRVIFFRSDYHSTSLEVDSHCWNNLLLLLMSDNGKGKKGVSSRLRPWTEKDAPHV